VDLAIFGVLMGFGFGLTIWFLSETALPLLYGIPRTICWAVKGWVKARAIALYLVAPLIWSLPFLGLAVGLTMFFPGTAGYLRGSTAFGLGQTAATLYLLGSFVFSKSTRNDAHQDFISFVRPFLTETGRILLAQEPDPGHVPKSSISISPAQRKNTASRPVGVKNQATALNPSETPSALTAPARHSMEAGAADCGLAALRELFSGLGVENEWSIREERAFRWWPHQLAQRIWAEPPHANVNAELCRIHVETDLLRDVPETARNAELLATLNMMASLSALVWDRQNRQIKQHCSVTVYRGGEQWFSRLLTVAAMLQADMALKANLLTDQTGAEVDTSSHPAMGHRSTPAPTLRALADALVEMQRSCPPVAEADLQHLVDTQPQPWIEATRQGNTIHARFSFLDDVGPASFIVSAQEEHPQLGRGVLARLTLPNVMDAQTAVEVANILNEAEVSNWDDFRNSGSGEPPQFLGAWCQNNNMVSHVTFLPAALMSREALGVMAYSAGQRVFFVRDFMVGYAVTMATSDALRSTPDAGPGKRDVRSALEDRLTKLGFKNARDLADKALGTPTAGGTDTVGTRLAVTPRAVVPKSGKVEYEVRCQRCSYAQKMWDEDRMWTAAEEHARQGHVVVASGRGVSLVMYKDGRFGGYEVMPGDNLGAWLKKSQ
jgi:hypothetical protein